MCKKQHINTVLVPVRCCWFGRADLQFCFGTWIANKIQNAQRAMVRLSLVALTPRPSCLPSPVYFVPISPSFFLACAARPGPARRRLACNKLLLFLTFAFVPPHLAPPRHARRCGCFVLPCRWNLISSGTANSRTMWRTFRTRWRRKRR